ncbi:hypothetical protein ES705_31996 [subsurface metagenome]
MDATDLSPGRGKIIEAPDLICAISNLDVVTAFLTKGDEVSVAAIVF